MARSVRQTRQRVILAPTLALVESAHRFVDAAGGYPDFGRLERNLLPALHHIPHFPLLGCRLTKHPGSRNVRLVAVQRATGIDQDDCTFADSLYNLGAVW